MNLFQVSRRSLVDRRKATAPTTENRRMKRIAHCLRKKMKKEDGSTAGAKQTKQEQKDDYAILPKSRIHRQLGKKI